MRSFWAARSQNFTAVGDSIYAQLNLQDLGSTLDHPNSELTGGRLESFLSSLEVQRTEGTDQLGSTTVPLCPEVFRRATRKYLELRMPTSTFSSVSGRSPVRSRMLTTCNFQSRSRDYITRTVASCQVPHNLLCSAPSPEAPPARKTP